MTKLITEDEKFEGLTEITEVCDSCGKSFQSKDLIEVEQQCSGWVEYPGAPPKEWTEIELQCSTCIESIESLRTGGKS